MLVQFHDCLLAKTVEGVLIQAHAFHLESRTDVALLHNSSFNNFDRIITQVA
jgi:hypothetical protein